MTGPLLYLLRMKTANSFYFPVQLRAAKAISFSNSSHYAKKAKLSPGLYSSEYCRTQLPEKNGAYKAKCEAKSRLFEGSWALCFNAEVITEVTTLSITRMLHRRRTMR